MKIKIGFSPCPNDTFILDAMVNGFIDTEGLEFDCVMEDVETLNEMAKADELAITKISFSTYLQVAKNYAILPCGSALGSGVGPLVLTKNPVPKAAHAEFLNNAKIAIPGFGTTANLLLSLAFPQATNKHAVVFNEIEKAVLAGEADAGLVIHESRFTYASRGLHKLIDLGEWWESETQSPIPLGCFVAQRSLEKGVVEKVNRLMQESLRLSWQHYPKLSNFVKENAQEMEEDVMRKHIHLYVNDLTHDLGDKGRKAVDKLMEYAAKAGLV